MFVDKAKIQIRAGRGGDGCVSFRHEKYIDKGGPDGGDGGKGGDVVLVGSNRTNTLATFRYQKEIIAKNGTAGFKRKKHGKSAPDLEIAVPVGTAVYDQENNLLGDITQENQKVVVAHGGRGGFGNAHFTSSRRQTPRVAEKGAPGDELLVNLELKIIAEVGIVGLPNAGKSTFLSRVTSAKPEIADYPFTTIKPNLGVAKVSDDRSLLIADIPGLIEGASRGKGLGDEFLRHVERTKVLLHMVDAYSENIEKTYKVIRNELEKYKIDLSKRPEIIVLTKIEGLDEDIVSDQIKKLKKVATKDSEIVSISSQSGQNLKELLFETAKLVDRENAKLEEIEVPEEGLTVISLGSSEKAWEVNKTDDGFVVTGPKIERFASQTNFDNYAGNDRLRDIMRKIGIMHELERKGIEEGDQIYFGEKAQFGPFEY
jgi:GTP-binding protein